MAVTVSLEVAEGLKAKLDQLPPAERRAAEALAETALEFAIDNKEEREDLEEVLRANRDGDYVTDEDMRTWLASWGSGSQLPPPQLVSEK